MNQIVEIISVTGENFCENYIECLEKLICLFMEIYLKYGFCLSLCWMTSSFMIEDRLMSYLTNKFSFFFFCNGLV